VSEQDFANLLNPNYQHQERDPDDETVAALIHTDMLESLACGTFWDPPTGIASDDRLSKLHHYACFLRIYLGFDLQRAA